MAEVQTLFLGILHVFLKNITLKKKKKTDKAAGVEGPEKSVSCGGRKAWGKEGEKMTWEPILPASLQGRKGRFGVLEL